MAAGLSMRELEVLALHVADCSYAKIALAGRLAVLTVKRQLMRARGKLRRDNRRMRETGETL